jgi:hypothetical protein
MGLPTEMRQQLFLATLILSFRCACMIQDVNGQYRLAKFPALLPSPLS